jgi:hypothetical protein
MDTLTLLLQLAFRSFVVLLPIVVGGLAFRRLALSKSSNAWIYAVTCLFAVVTTAGLLPWVVGVSASNWIFFVLAAFCPGLWFAVTLICDVSRKSSYSFESEAVPTILFKAKQNTPVAPLVLSDPVLNHPVPVFTHHKPAKVSAPKKKPLVLRTDARMPSNETTESLQSAKREKSVLDVAREMRRNTSSEDRRTKLLPAPSLKELPFIKSAGTA